MDRAQSDHPVSIAFLGPKGTYTYQAALQEFGHQKQAKFVCANSIPECFKKLDSEKSVDYSVVPLENSTNGQVVFTYDLLRDQMMAGFDESADENRVIPAIEVVSEQYVSIVHCLISPGVNSLENLPKYKKIRIYSHPQVWGQVSEYLEKLKRQCPNTLIEKIDTPSTSEAVRKAQLSSQQDSELSLAIASETAAELHNAHVIDEEINDIPGNTTRFLVFKRRDPHHITQSADPKAVCLMTFAVKVDDPGSLVDVLSVLKNHGMNTCSINSRPLNNKQIRKNRNWQYLFFIEYYNSAEKRDEETFYRDISNSCSSWCLWGTFGRNERYHSR